MKGETYLIYLQEKQKAYLELLKVWTALVIATTGGLVGLLFKVDHPLALPLIWLGVWLDTSFLIAFIITLGQISLTLQEIRKWKENS
jgi:hypothetical protein